MDSAFFSESIVDVLDANGVEFSISVPFARELTKIQNKKPVQLDMFTPYDYEHEFKVVLTNKRLNVKKLINYHNGRGYQ